MPTLLHPLLTRQLRKGGFDGEDLSPEMKKFVAAVNEAYHSFEKDHSLAKRSIQLSSAELAKANYDLRDLLESFPEILRQFDKHGAQYDYREMITSYVRELEESRDRVQKQATMLQAQAYELMLARDEAIEAGRLKSEFLANTSHEIRTPLHGTLGMLRLLKKTDLDVQQREYLRLGEQSALTLLSLVNDILDFSKAEAGKLDLEIGVFNLRSVLQEAISPVVLRANETNVELIFECPANTPNVLRGDSNRLRQVLLNLLGNAIKFTRVGYVLLKVLVVQQSEGSARFRFVVEDSGIGIPEERKAKIFEAFTQADGSTTRKYGGTGLGLAISTRLVQLMGGKITLDSEVGKGSSFSFEIELGTEQEPQWVETVPIIEKLLRDSDVFTLGIVGLMAPHLHGTLNRWGVKTHALSGIAELIERTSCIGAESYQKPVVIFDAKLADANDKAVGGDILNLVQNGRCNAIVLVPLGKLNLAAMWRNVPGVLIQTAPFSERRLIGRLLSAYGHQGFDWLYLSHRDQEGPLLSTEKKLHILVADDIHVNRVVAQRLLEEMGHTVTLAEDGKEVLGFLKKGNHFTTSAAEQPPFDMLLLDIQMPQLDGVETAQIIRSLETRSEAGQSLPIIALTAHALRGDRERFLEAGIDDYLSKPLNLDQLQQIMRRLSPSTFNEYDTQSLAQISPSQSTSDDSLYHRLASLLMQDESKDPSTSPLCSLDLLVTRFSGNKETIEEIATIFLEEAPELLTRIIAAHSKSDTTQFWKAAHALKGSCLNVGGSACADAAFALEQVGRAGNIDNTNGLIDTCKREFARLTEFIRSVVALLQHDHDLESSSFSETSQSI